MIRSEKKREKGIKENWYRTWMASFVTATYSFGKWKRSVEEISWNQGGRYVWHGGILFTSPDDAGEDCVYDDKGSRYGRHCS